RASCPLGRGHPARAFLRERDAPAPAGKMPALLPSGTAYSVTSLIQPRHRIAFSLHLMLQIPFCLQLITLATTM
ncbi:MAG: hypothetical protein ACLQVG_33215, partial [Terriglobia bacterium]